MHGTFFVIVVTVMFCFCFIERFIWISQHNWCDCLDGVNGRNDDDDKDTIEFLYILFWNKLQPLELELLIYKDGDQIEEVDYNTT